MNFWHAILFQVSVNVLLVKTGQVLVPCYEPMQLMLAVRCFSWKTVGLLQPRYANVFVWVFNGRAKMMGRVLWFDVVG